MKIDFTQELKTIEGDTLQRQKVNRRENKIEEIDATLKWAAVEALLTVDPKAEISGEEKAKRYEIALKVQEATGPIEISVDDAALIKKLCDQHFTPLIVGQTRRLLDPKGD